MKLLEAPKDILRGRMTMRTRRRLAERRVRVRAITSRRRVYPDFLVLGAQRSGTSSLYRYLGSHPDLVASIRKETGYFTTRFHEGSGWYRAHFPLQVRMVLHERLIGTGPLSFEATPDYLFHPSAPGRVSEVLPNAKFIVLLRDPVDRAFSHYKHMRRLNFEDLPFADAIAAEGNRIQQDLMEIEKPGPHPFVQALRFSYLHRGRYAEQLEHWMSYFEREQFLILDFHEFIDDPKETLEVITDFLGVRTWSPEIFPNYSVRRGPANSDSHRELNDTLAGELRSEFAQGNRRLTEITGRKFSWM